MSDTNLPATSIAALFGPLAKLRAELVELTTRRDALSAQRDQLGAQVVERSASASSEDAEAVRFLTEARVRLDLVERDLASVLKAIGPAENQLSNAVMASARAGMAAREAMDKQIAEELHVQFLKLSEPYEPVRMALSEFAFGLRDADFRPTDEAQSLRWSARLLEAHAKLLQALSPV